MGAITAAYCPCPSKEEALRLAGELLKRELIACANLIPITSVYRWEGNVEQEDEVVLLAKTTPERYAEVRDTLAELHPYDVPAVIKLDGLANEAYSDWVVGEVKGEL